MRKESTFRLSLLFQWVPWKPAMFSKMHNSNTKNVQLLKWLHRCLTYTACRFIHAHGGERKKALPGKLRIKDPECKFNLATCRCLHRTCHLDSCRISPKVKKHSYSRSVVSYCRSRIKVIMVNHPYSVSN